ncbi:MAG: hypothetical protein ACI3XR_04970 [Eubacteriales bacterium]
MQYRTDNTGLDDLSTPILICDRSGLVLYKNEIAVKQIRLPKRRTGILIHLDSAGKAAFSDMNTDSRPRVLSVYTGDRNAKAFVVPYRYQDSDCTLWVFPGFMQVNPNSVLFSALEKDAEKIAGDLCSVFALVAEKKEIPPGRSHNALNKKIRAKLEHMLDTMLECGDDRVNWPLSECLRILSGQIFGIFRTYGYMIDFKDSVPQNLKGMFLNFLNFIVFYSHALTFCCELTRSHRISVEVCEENENCIVLTAVFTILFSPIYIENSSDFRNLIPLFPEHMVDLLIFEKLAASCGYRISYSVVDRHQDNVTFRFVVPLTAKRGLSAKRTAEREFQLLEGDCLRLIESLFECAFFYRNAPEKEDI